MRPRKARLPAQAAAPRRFLRSFYARVAAVFLLLLTLLGAAYLWLAASSSVRLTAETEQRLGRRYAQNVAAELQPVVAKGLSLERVGGLIHYMMSLNPKVEIYLLDSRGRILAYFTDPPAQVALTSLDLAPVRRFLAGEGGSLLLGPDPRNPGRLKPFSAAPLQMAGEQGYVYIILGGERYDSALRMLGESYVVRASLAAILLALLGTGLVGLLLFGLLTRRLRRLEATVQAFERGERSLRVPARGSDEIDGLGRSFNRMADTLTANLARLENTDRERRDLVAQISHDFRSPLASIRGYLETLLLKGRSLSEAQQKHFLEVAWKNALGLQELVEQFFELARLDTRQVRPRFEPVPPGELVQDVLLKLRPRAEEAGIALEANPADGLPLVQVDPLMIERVLTNLIDNSLRHTPPGGSVCVILEPPFPGLARRDSEKDPDGAVMVTVADTGSGIAADELPSLFDPFAAARARPHRPKGGAGLGLAIAQRLVQLHGGRLEVDSRLGHGTRFRFPLPRM
jgi:two-component system OmpR family sensor kinase